MKMQSLMGIAARVLASVVLISGLAPALVEGAIITYSSRADFAASVSGEVVEGWDTLANGTVIGTLNGVSYDPSGGDALVTNAFLPLSSPNALGDTTGGFFAGAETMTFTFSSPITAFGISFNTFATAIGAYTATTNLGDVAQSVFDPFPGSTTGQFVGFSSDTPFTSVVLTNVTGTSYTLDDLNYVTATRSPEPATLLLLGLGSMFLTRRWPGSF